MIIVINVMTVTVAIVVTSVTPVINATNTMMKGLVTTSVAEWRMTIILALELDTEMKIHVSPINTMTEDLQTPSVHVMINHEHLSLQCQPPTQVMITEGSVLTTERMRRRGKSSETRIIEGKGLAE